jgi:hypothetical protein
VTTTHEIPGYEQVPPGHPAALDSLPNARSHDEGRGCEEPARRPSPPEFEHLVARLEAGYEFHTKQLELLAGDVDAEHAFDRESLAATSRRALRMIAAALRDMADGRYGVCTTCGQPIPLERLDARPEARHCLRCQARTGR